MSLETALARVAELQTALRPPAAAVPPSPAAGGDTRFATMLQGAAAAPAGAAAPAALAPGAGPGARIVAAARGELGQAEQPPGSNNSPRIAEYRRAVPGGPVGPWCAYFASWAARQAGTPLGEQGQGFASVEGVWSWAQRTGRALPAGAQPQAGDLIVWGGRHMGIVESVLPDGRIQTIEGNSSDQVARRTYPPGSGTGYVRLG